MKKKILLDIDGVMANMKRHLQDKLHKIAYEKGIKIQCDNTNYSFSKYLGPELTRLLFDELYDDFIENGEAYDYISEVTHKLSEKYEIHIVTSRGTGDPKQFTEDEIKKKELHRVNTKKWLDKHNIVYNYLVFDCDKINYINNNNIDVAVEDWLDTLLKIETRTQAIPICYDQTYNKAAKSLGIQVAYSWYDLLVKIENALEKKK
ncbi:MAG: hypothetical protein J6A59_02740 [Lachnospiraceae bacterium]|nr:hypothetical protein [Lachnospiraceae bacterium]